MASGIRPENVMTLTAMIFASLGIAHAQEPGAPQMGVLVFVLVFVGGLILFAYIASKLMAPSKPHIEEQIIPLPVTRRR